MKKGISILITMFQTEPTSILFYKNKLDKSQ